MDTANIVTTVISAPKFAEIKSAIPPKTLTKGPCICMKKSLILVANLSKGLSSLSASCSIAPKFAINCLCTSSNTAALLCDMVNFSAINPLAFANFLVAMSNLRIIPSSSSSSGSAFVTPRISLLNESVKSLPRVTEANLAPSANPASWSCVNPAAIPIEACCAASWKFKRPPVAPLTAAVTPIMDCPVISPNILNPLI